MARKVSTLDELHLMKQTWKLSVRITNLWVYEKAATKSEMHMVLMDHKGKKIAATVHHQHFNKWKDILKEGQTFVIQNLGVSENKDTEYKSTRHLYKLHFLKTTNVQPKESPEIPIPQNDYEFTKFEDILNGTAKPEFLIDVIGQFDKFERIEKDDPHMVQMLMKDTGTGCKLSWTLWEGYADQVLSFMENNPTGPIVMLLTLGKIKDTKGKYPICIQNSKVASKLLINADIPEINDYKNSCTWDPNTDSCSQAMTQISGSSQSRYSQFSQMTEEQNFLQNAQIRTLKEFRELKQETNCLTVGMIDMLYSHNPWCYPSCLYCNKRALVENGAFTCVKCKQHCTHSSLRFKVEVRISHNGGDANLVLFDQVCTQLFGSTALELRKKQIEEGEEEDSFPEVIDTLLGMYLAFKVKVRPNATNHGVSLILDKKEIINMISEQIQSYQELCQANQKKPIFTLITSQEVNDSQTFSTSAENDPIAVDLRTPSKRKQPTDKQFDEGGDEQLTPYQLSSTKHIKAE